jgi:pSer/pThr/pTyr-binding forkhead associated (FHA) protein
MDESRQPTEADGLSLPGFFPLRLILQPSGTVIELTRPDMLLGRHSEADVRLPLPDVSRRHCRCLFTDGGWRVIDLNSLNGLWVNGEPVLQAELRQDDLLNIGGFTFAVDLSAGQTDPATEVEGEDGPLRAIFKVLPPPDPEAIRRRRAS